jgi:sporadic carbohydrate cluster protein (TIGR04323 family)
MGYRGYISSRPFGGERAPQHVQNIVIRAFCERKNFQYLLSATEFAMPNCFLMLEQLLRNIETVDGIVFYSLKQLPSQSVKKKEILQRVIAANRSIHFAVEGLSVSDYLSAERVDEITLVQSVLPSCLSMETLRASVKA